MHRQHVLDRRSRSADTLAAVRGQQGGRHQPDDQRRSRPCAARHPGQRRAAPASSTRRSTGTSTRLLGQQGQGLPPGEFLRRRCRDGAARPDRDAGRCGGGGGLPRRTRTRAYMTGPVAQRRRGARLAPDALRWARGGHLVLRATVVLRGPSLLDPRVRPHCAGDPRLRRRPAGRRRTDPRGPGDGPNRSTCRTTGSIVPGSDRSPHACLRRCRRWRRCRHLSVSIVGSTTVVGRRQRRRLDHRGVRTAIAAALRGPASSPGSTSRPIGLIDTRVGELVRGAVSRRGGRRRGGPGTPRLRHRVQGSALERTPPGAASGRVLDALLEAADATGLPVMVHVGDTDERLADIVASASVRATWSPIP